MAMYGTLKVSLLPQRWKCGQRNNKKKEKRFNKMTETHGNTQSYLGMNFNIKNKRIHMEMKEYLLDCINDFLEKISSAAKIPATKTLMETN